MYLQANSYVCKEIDKYSSDTESSITYSDNDDKKIKGKISKSAIIKEKQRNKNNEINIKKNIKISDMISIKTQVNYTCKYCNFITTKNSDWSRHIKTQKHKRNAGTEEKLFKCDCGNTYKHSQSLWNHRKKCNTQGSTDIEDGYLTSYNEDTTNKIENIETKNNDNYVKNDYMMEFIKQNKELQNIIVEQNKEFKTLISEQNKEFNNKLLEIAKNQTITNNVQNNIQTINNNIFNLNVFLNEQCKDAVNMEDFLNSIELSIVDLEETGRLGFVSGISKIFIEHIKKMDIHERPLHCTDIKREIVYIKDNNSWEKEDAEKTKLINAVKKIVKKNLLQMVYWREQNPDYLKSNTKANDDYCRISLNSLGPYSEEDEKRELNKIMRIVLKEITISKYKEDFKAIL